MTTVAEATGKLGLEVDQQSVAQVNTVLGTLGQKLMALISIGAGVALANHLRNQTVELARQAEATLIAANANRISVESQQQLEFAAASTGASVASLADAMNRTAQASEKASRGDKAASKTLRGLGLSARELRQLAPDEQLMRVSEALDQIGDPSRRRGLQEALFGTISPEMQRLLDGGGAGLKQAKSDSQGLTLSQEQLEDAQRFNDTLREMEAIGLHIKKLFVAELVPSIQPLLDDMRDGSASATRGQIRELAKSVGELLKVVRSGLRELREFTEIMGGLGNVLKLLAITVGSIIAAKLLTDLAGGFSILSVEGLKAAASTALANLKFLLLAAAIAVVLLALEDFYGWTEGKDSVTGEILGDFTPEKLTKIQDDITGVLELLKGFYENPGDTIVSYLKAQLHELETEFIMAMMRIAEKMKPLFDVKAHLKAQLGDVLSGGPGELAQSLFSDTKAGVTAYAHDAQSSVVKLKKDTEAQLNTYARDALMSGADMLASWAGGGASSPQVDSAAQVQRQAAQAQRVDVGGVSVSVDARGATDPEAVRVAVQDGVMDGLLRQARNAFQRGPS